MVVVVIATRPCLANVKNDFHETNGGNICNYTAQVSRGGLGGGGVGVSEKNSSGMLLGERKFSGGKMSGHNALIRYDIGAYVFILIA